MLKEHISILVILSLCGAQEVDRPIVEITLGLVQGKTVATHYPGVSVNSFYGIPYGQPTGGELRFSDPLPAEPWGDDILNATTDNGLPPACTQARFGVTVITHPLYDNFDEDCLNVNVFTPSDMSPEAPYPVMVYFYGGAYLSGANIMYPGHFLAARDVVVVVVNYRVGVFGFLNTEPGDPLNLSNAAFYDQTLALEWVRDNIAPFGGNPDQVTIFGQSAGASSVALHTVSPVSRGLYHAVIQQSGSDSTFWAVNWPTQEPWEYPKQTAEKLGCPTEPSEDMVACLRAVDQWELQGNWSISCTPGYFCQGHGPVIDGPGRFLPNYPLVQRENGEFSQVPLMSGYNSEDGSLYVLAFIPESLEGGFNRSEFQFMLYDRFVKIWEDSMTPEQATDAYWATDFFYTPWPYIEDEDLNRRALVEMTTDAPWGYPQDRQLKLHSEVAPSYWYVFGYRSTNTTDGIFEDTEWAGVPHSAEIPYVYGWVLLKLAPEVRQDSRILIDIADWNEADFEYADFTMDLFTNFAKYFNPTPEPIEAPQGHGPITWPAVSQDELNYIWISLDDVEARINYRQKEHAFFREYLSYVVGRPLFYDAEENTPARKPKRALNSFVYEKTMQKLAYKLLTEQYEEYFPFEEFEEFDPEEEIEMFKEF